MKGKQVQELDIKKLKFSTPGGRGGGTGKKEPRGILSPEQTKLKRATRTRGRESVKKEEEGFGNQKVGLAGFVGS